MADQYYMDLEQFSLQKFRQILETKELMPGRRILRENIQERFAIVASLGITNMQQLTERLKTKKQVESFCLESGLPQDYVVILRREAYSYLPKPVNLGEIPEVDPQNIERLAGVGIKHTRQLFDRGRSKSDRARLCRETGVPAGELLELVGLSDLARIGGVGPVFARIIYDAGYDTLARLAGASADEVYEQLVLLNQEKEFTRAKFTVKDVRFCVITARELPKVIEYE